MQKETKEQTTSECAEVVLTPGHTQTPNYYLDHLMHQLSGAEFKCLMYIVRRTYGFHKRMDKISISQFENGVKTTDENGEEMQLDYGTGLTRKTIIEALNTLEERGLIVRTSGRVKKYQMVEKLHQTSVKITPKVVEKLHPQKKGNKVIQNKDRGDAPDGGKITPVSEANKKHEDTPEEVKQGLAICRVLSPNTYQHWFGNKTQRTAAAQVYRLEQKNSDYLHWLIGTAAEIQGKEYAPVIDTPDSFIKKMEKLRAYIKRHGIMYKHTADESEEHAANELGYSIYD